MDDRLFAERNCHGDVSGLSLLKQGGRRHSAAYIPVPVLSRKGWWERPTASNWIRPSPATHRSRCASSSQCQQNRNPEHGDVNEKAQNHGTHLAGRRDPDNRRRRRFCLRRLDRALSDPCWPRGTPCRAWRELRSAAWPSHLRSLVGLLAKGAEQSDGGLPE